MIHDVRNINGSTVFYNGGHVGIGTTTPVYPLERVSTGGRTINATHTATTGTGYGVMGQSDSNDGRGLLGFASAASGLTYGVLGQSNSADGFDFFAGGAGTNYGSSSSIRWKSNIRNIDQPLEKIARLRGVYYTWDKEHVGRHDLGMIAEEVGAVLPEIVQYEENGIDAIGMDYSKMTPRLVEAVNALRAEKDAEITKLKAEKDAGIANLTSRLDRMEEALEQLTGAIQE